MNLRVLALTFFISLVASSSFSQDYISRALSGNASIHELKASFEDHWNGKTPTKGKGYKQFQRWLNFVEPRTYPSGYLPEPDIAWKEIQKFKKDHPKSQRKSSGTWTQDMFHNNLLFTPFSINTGHGRVSCVEIHPQDSNTILIGTPSGGLWKSTNAGSSWEAMTDELPVLGVADLLFDPRDPQIIYMATGDNDFIHTYSIGVLKSLDGGLSWDSTGLNYAVNQIINIRKLLIHPYNTDTLWALGSNGIMRSMDGGDSWTQVMIGNMRDIEFKPGSIDTIFASSNSGFYRSVDGGGSFANIGLLENPAINRLELAISPSNPDVVYALAAAASDGGFYALYRSTDGGGSFTQTNNTQNILGYLQTGGVGGQGWFDMDIVVDPLDENQVFTAGINIWKSINGGDSFFPTSNWSLPGTSLHVHGDVHKLEFVGDRLYTTHDGGISYSDNRGAAWTDISSNLSIHQIYAFNHSPFDPDRVIAGMQDVGSSIYNGSDWVTISWGDGFESFFHSHDPQTMYTTAHTGFFFKTTTGINGFYLLNTPGSETSPFGTVLRQDHWFPDKLYLGLQNVWRSTNGASTWTRISNFGNTFPLQRLEVSKSKPDAIYATSNFLAYRTFNDGNLWTGITTGLPTASAAISDLYIDPSNHLNVWICFSGYSSGNKVYQSTDGGSSWVNISGNLPNLPANSFILEESALNGMYVGMDVGVFYKNDTMSNWEPYFDGLPNVIINDLQILPTLGIIRAATFGRGVWEAPTWSVPLISNVNSPKPTAGKVFNLYPNPGQDRFFIGMEPGFNQAWLEILDPTGRELISRSIIDPEIMIDASSWESGIYLLRIRSGETTETRKWVKRD